MQENGTVKASGVKSGSLKISTANTRLHEVARAGGPHRPTQLTLDQQHASNSCSTTRIEMTSNLTTRLNKGPLPFDHYPNTRANAPPQW